jgi:transportin-1
MRDQNKRVQKAATSAIAQVIDNSQKLDIMPYIEAIAQSFNNAFRSFQKGNMAVLYDATISVAAVLRGDMNKDPFREYLLQPLLHKWESMGDDDMDLFPLLECLSHIAIYMGSAFVNYCKPIFDRSLRLIEMVLLGNALHLQDTNHAMPNREFLICSLDMISALCDALRGSIEPLINSSKLIPLLIEICKESSPDYCQSAFALVGDIAKHTTNTLPSASPVLIPLLIKGTSSRYYEAANNAVWALGEIIIKVGPDIVEPHAENIYKAVLDVFSTAEEERMLETCSVTIGRLGINFPNILAPNLKGIFKQMCNSLRPLPNESSKLDAIRGLCEAVLKNPRDILHNFESFCDLIAGVNDASLEGVFGPLLQGFKNEINPNEWNQKIDILKPGTKNTLRKKYNL